MAGAFEFAAPPALLRRMVVRQVYRKRACIVAGVCSQQDPSVYVESACRLIAETRGAVWRIFLPVVWRAAMAEGNRSLVNSLIDQLKMQAAPRLPAAEQARGERASLECIFADDCRWCL